MRSFGRRKRKGKKKPASDVGKETKTECKKTKLLLFNIEFDRGTEMGITSTLPCGVTLDNLQRAGSAVVGVAMAEGSCPMEFERSSRMELLGIHTG